MLNKNVKGVVRSIPNSVGKTAVDVYGIVEGTVDVIREYKHNRPLQDLIDSMTPNVDVFVGYVVAYTQEGPLEGLRVVDGVQLSINDTVLVTGLGERNGIYRVNLGPWTRLVEVEPYQLVSINRGAYYAGTIVKKLPDGTSEIVKQQDNPMWSVIL